MSAEEEEAQIWLSAKMPNFGGFVPPFPWPVVRSTLVITLGAFIMAIGGFVTSYLDVAPVTGTSPVYPVFNKPAAVSLVTHVLFNLAILIAIMVAMLLTMHSIAMWGMFSNAASKGNVSMHMTLDEMIEKIPNTGVRVQAESLAKKMKGLLATPTAAKVQEGAAARVASARVLMRECYVLSLHAMSICNIQLCIILFVASVLAAPIFSLSPLLYLGALIMVAGSMACRWYVAIDISYLYSKIFDLDEQIVGIPWGAVRCLLFTATGMLLLDGGLFKVADSFKANGLGLPPAIEAPLLNVWDWLMFYCELGTFPICFAGLSANIVSIRRGSYLQPNCEGNETCCIASRYAADAANALKVGQWDAFQKAKKFRTQLAILIFGGVLSGVFTLIPIYWAIYAVVQGYIGICATDSTLPADFEFLGNLIGAEPSYFAAIGSIDAAKFTAITCGSEIRPGQANGFLHMSFWLFVMLTGLFMHLPGIGGGWANLNKYTGLMTVIDTSLTGGVAVGKKTMV